MLRPRAALLASAVLAVVADAAAQRPATTTLAVGDATVVLVDGATAPTATVLRPGVRPFQLPATDGLLHLRAGRFDPRNGMPAFAGRLQAPAGSRLFFVQFHSAIVPEYRAELLARGLEILGHWPSSAFLVRGDRATVEALRTVPFVRCVGDVPVGTKVDPALWPRLTEVAASNVAVEPAEYALVLARKADRERLAGAVREVGGFVSKWNDGSTMLQARLSPAQLAAVVAEDTVVWAEAAPTIERDLNNARIQGGANTVEFGAGLTGNGVRVQILEGIDELHPDWTHTPLLHYDDDTDAHGHCTAMIVAGNGAGNTNARGIIPDAWLVESAVSVWNATLSRYSVTAAAIDPGQPWRCMQQTASWGYTAALDYNAGSQELDDLLFDLDVTATQSQSNTGTQNSRPQAWAKNVISVGGVYHFDDSNAANDVWRVTGQTPSSIGPAADGRIKPDVVAYYDSIQCGDLSGPAGYSSTNYTSSFGGTSGATPIVNGYVGLLQQMFTDGLFGNRLPLPATAANRFANRAHMTTMKALLCNTTSSYAFSGATADLTRTHQGWGFPDVARAWQNRQRLLAVDEYDVLKQGETRTYYVHVRPGTAEFRVTMAYADPAALPSAAIHRINNLDLQVVRFADGVSWWGNNGLDVGNQSQPGGSANDRDTIEQVWLPNPQAGFYAVTVSAPLLVQDAHVETPAVDADFALVMHPLGGGFRAPSTLALDVVSTAPGDLRLQLGSVPTSGWTEGFTLISLNGSRPLGYGNLLGIERDMWTEAVLSQPLALGDVFHFPNAGPGTFPFQPYVAPVPVALALRGLTLDAVTVLLNAGQVVEISNVDRLAVP